MRAAREQRDVGAGLRQPRADVAADGARAGDDDSSRCALRERLRPRRARWILPVAVRGIASMMWICFGRLKSASRSRQYASRSASVAGSLQHDRGRHFFAPGRVRHAEAHRFGHRRMREQHLVDLARRDLLAAAVDQLLEAADERQIAVRVEDSPDRRCGTSRRRTTSRWPRDCSRSRVITFGPLITTSPRSPARQVAALRVHDADLHVGPRPDRSGLARRRRQRIGRHLVRGFGHAVRFEHRRAERRFQIVHHLRRQRRAARADEAQRLGARRPALRRLGAREQQLVDRRHRRVPGDAVIARDAPERQRIELAPARPPCRRSTASPASTRPGRARGTAASRTATRRRGPSA